MKKLRIILKVLFILLSDPRLLFSLIKNVSSIRRLRKKARYSNRTLTIVALSEQLGDVVASEPVSRYLKSKDPGLYLIWVVDKKYEELIATNPNIDKSITITSFSEWILLKHFLRGILIYDLHINGMVCTMHHLVNYKENPFGITFENYLKGHNLLFAFSRSAGIEIPDETSPVLYLQPDDTGIKGKYIVFHTDSNNDLKKWDDECWNHLATYILDHYGAYSIVEVGFKKKITIQHNNIRDFTGSKKLGYLASLIRNCSLFIGTDSGLAHFANAMEKDSLVLIGELGAFKHYMPYSGKFMKEKENIIVYHDGPLSAMPCDALNARLALKLGSNI